MTKPRKRPAGATYQLRELAELARRSAAEWAAYAASPRLNPQLAYGANTMRELEFVAAYVLDQMADVEKQTDPAPPAFEATGTTR